MTRKAAGDRAIEKLIADGWKISHTATVHDYRFAGTVSPMRSHDGQEFCRVHHGRCVGRYNYQITTVMMRPVIC